MVRVSTANLHNTVLTQMQRSNEQINLTTYQISSGNKAQRLEQIANQSNQLLSLQELQSNSDIYVKSMETAKSRLSATENALNSLSDLMTEAASLWTLARNEQTPETRAALAPKAEGLMNSFQNIFLTKFDGRFIFSGQNGSTAPTNSTPAARAYPGNPAPTTYYTGDTAKTSVITGPGTTATYGVTGDDPAFADMKAGLEALWYGLLNDSTTDIDGGINLLEDAQKELNDVTGQVGGQQSGFTLQIDRHKSSKTFLTERIDEIDKVDITEAMTTFTQQQAALEASMLALTRLSSLNLLDFIR